MSPHFLCYECLGVPLCDSNTESCPSCGSKRGRLITDAEFREQYSTGAIRLIDPRTKKAFKKNKK